MRRWTRIAGLLLSAILVAGTVPAAGAADGDIGLYVNGRQTLMPSPIINQAGRVLVPMRAYLESIGATVEWHPPDTVTAQMAGHTVQLTIGSTTAYVDGRGVALDVPAQIIADRTYLPLRFLSEGLGAYVHWDGQSVHVRTHGAPQIVVIDGPLNIRQGPSTSTPILTTVPEGTILDVVAEEQGWTKIWTPRWGEAWVASQYTAPYTPPPVADAFLPYFAKGAAFLQIGGTCVGATPIVDGTAYVPLKQSVVRLGGTFAASGVSVDAHLGGRHLRLTLEERTALLDGEPVDLGGPPLVMGGQVLLPARTVASLFGLPLGWSDSLRTVSLGTDTPTEVCNPSSPADAYIIVDAGTGVVLAERNANVAYPVASTTKIMTAILAVERGDPDSIVTVSWNAANQPGTSMYLRTGEQRRLQDLLFGLMMVSGNDAATAIAEHLAGSESAFAQLMNQRAAEIGAQNTHFLNASGLDDWVNPYSTARDLATMARHGLQNLEFRVYASQKQRTVPGPSGPRLLKNSNDFVLTYPGATGVKNGWTEKADYTLVASAYRGGRELIVVLLGVPTRPGVYQEATRLMDHGFRLVDQAWLLETDL